MPDKQIRWRFLSFLIIGSFFSLQALRWMILPHFMDIYYHLLTANGFLASGGYCGWNFWEFAPVGRMHTYPPFFHFLLAGLIKSGIDRMVIAKCIEAAMPVLFLAVLWNFARKNYSERFAFFVLLVVASSFSFYLSLMNFLPASLALVFGILALGQLLKGNFPRVFLWLVLSFYTHLAVALFFTIGIALYAFFNRSMLKNTIFSCLGALLLAGPVIFKQLAALKLISISGINARYFCEFKLIEYSLAAMGMVLSFRKQKKYALFFSLFFASFIFLPYPARFFSSQGYLPVIFLASVGLEHIFKKYSLSKFSPKFLLAVFAILLLLFSPTVSVGRESTKKAFQWSISFFDSAFLNAFQPQLHSRLTATNIYVDKEYKEVIKLIKENSRPDEIIFSALNNVGVCLASLSERATANALLPELGPAHPFDPFSSSRIFIALKDDKPREVDFIVKNYKLEKIGENKLFTVYKNPAPKAIVVPKKAAVPFWAIGIIAISFIFLYCQNWVEF